MAYRRVLCPRWRGGGWVCRCWFLGLALLALSTSIGAPAKAQEDLSATLAQPAPAQDIPTLLFDVATGQEATAKRLESLAPQRLEAAAQRIGWARGGTIRVILAAEDSPLARSAPAWINGYALPQVDAVVLLPERLPHYPSGSLEDVLVHEVAHILIARASGGAPVPRWFHEGLAMAAEGRWSAADAVRFEWARLRLRPLDLEELSAAFAGDEGEVAKAYAVSGAFLWDLERRWGRDLSARILKRMRSGESFDRAFQIATGRSPALALQQFGTLEATWRRWIPFLTSTTALWMAVTALALLAFLRRRERDRQLRQAWEAEELATSQREREARERWLDGHRLPSSSAGESPPGKEWIH